MKELIMIPVAIALIALGSTLAPSLNADEGNQLTTITFSSPVEIPRQVLRAGTYGLFQIIV